MADQARQGLAGRSRRGADERAGPDLLTSRRYPIYCKPIQKSGCTTIKNLFYRLDTGAWLDDPQSIHRRQRELLLFTGPEAPAEEVVAKGRGFAIVRKPLDRFLSFYFDKLAARAGRPPDMPWLVESLATRYGFDPSPDLDVEALRRNLLLTLDFIEDNLRGETPEGRDPHWTRQSGVLTRAAPAPLTIIPLEHMAEGIDRLVGDVAPGIGDLIRSAPRFNETNWRRDVDQDALVTRALLQRVRGIFRDDYRIYREAVAAHEAGGGRVG